MVDVEKGEQKKDSIEEKLKGKSDKELANMVEDPMSEVTTTDTPEDSVWADKSLDDIKNAAQQEVERRKLANMK